MFKTSLKQLNSYKQKERCQYSNALLKVFKNSDY